MAIVTYVLGACPACGALDSFGNVGVFKTFVLRGCKRCPHSERVHLPPIHKRVLYLDQFFFSGVFRAGDRRFLDLAQRVVRLTQLQLLVVPYSSIHEDETHQWANAAGLFKFIKATAKGEKYESAYEIERTQLVRAFRRWLAKEPADYRLKPEDALRRDVHAWTSYVRIEVGSYRGDVDLIRELKRKSIEGLVDLFGGWRERVTTFERDVDAEYGAAARGYLDFYLRFATRIAHGDYDALFDAPVASMIVQTMLHLIPADVPSDQHFALCAEFFRSEHFKEVPYQWLHAHMLATLQAMVRDGAYTNRARALERLSGFFFDVKHIATYAPYVDAFIMDGPMAELIARPTVGLEQRYRTRVFSPNNLHDFIAWLDEVENVGMTADHRAALDVAYPGLQA